jgi:hypothetical protein
MVSRSPHLADEDDVWVLTQDRPQAVRIALRVSPHLPLVDDALIGLVDVLDRVLQRDDVLLPFVVDLVDDGGQGC